MRSKEKSSKIFEEKVLKINFHIVIKLRNFHRDESSAEKRAAK